MAAGVTAAGAIAGATTFRGSSALGASLAAVALALDQNLVKLDGRYASTTTASCLIDIVHFARSLMATQIPAPMATSDSPTLTVLDEVLSWTARLAGEGGVIALFVQIGALRLMWFFWSCCASHTKCRTGSNALLQATDELVADTAAPYEELDAVPDAFVQALQTAAGALSKHFNQHALNVGPLLNFHLELQRLLKLVEALSDHSLFDVQTLLGIRGGAEAEGELAQGGSDAALCVRNVAPACFLRHRFKAITADFLARFRSDGQGVGFAVLGGVFAEGVDLPGSLLIGAFIVTLGLPPVSVVQDHLQVRLDKLFGAGPGYADLVPAMQRVVQAAGRVLRAPQDRGWLWLLDDRYRRAEVSELLPPWWRLAETPQALGLATVIGGCDGLEKIDAESPDDVACVTR